MEPNKKKTIHIASHWLPHGAKQWQKICISNYLNPIKNSDITYPNEFQCNQLEAFGFESLQDLSNKATLDTIWFNHDESTFLVTGHFSCYYGEYAQQKTDHTRSNDKDWMLTRMTNYRCVCWCYEANWLAFFSSHTYDTLYSLIGLCVGEQRPHGQAVYVIQYNYFVCGLRIGGARNDIVSEHVSLHLKQIHSYWKIIFGLLWIFLQKIFFHEKFC